MEACICVYNVDDKNDDAFFRCFMWGRIYNLLFGEFGLLIYTIYPKMYIYIICIWNECNTYIYTYIIVASASSLAFCYFVGVKIIYVSWILWGICVKYTFKHKMFAFSSPHTYVYSIFTFCDVSAGRVEGVRGVCCDENILFDNLIN